jgi:DNA-binding GntR family transcriptional regulator
MTRQANQAAEELYRQIKNEIFDFLLLPGDRFTETELASRYGVSRTPVRAALYRLKHEGYFEVQFRSGWSVKPFDFVRFDELYDLRAILEITAVERLCQMNDAPLSALTDIWLRPPALRENDAKAVAQLDEDFHCMLVEAAGNREMTRVNSEVTEKIRVLRRFGFLTQERIDTTYEEHAKLLKLIRTHRWPEASILLRAHIVHNKMEARKITIHMLHEARESSLSAAEEFRDQAGANTGPRTAVPAAREVAGRRQRAASV